MTLLEKKSKRKVSRARNVVMGLASIPCEVLQVLMMMPAFIVSWILSNLRSHQKLQRTTRFVWRKKMNVILCLSCRSVWKHQLQTIPIVKDCKQRLRLLRIPLQRVVLRTYYHLVVLRYLPSTDLAPPIDGMPGGYESCGGNGPFLIEVEEENGKFQGWYSLPPNYVQAKAFPLNLLTSCDCACICKQNQFCAASFWETNTPNFGLSFDCRLYYISTESFPVGPPLGSAMQNRQYACSQPFANEADAISVCVDNLGIDRWSNSCESCDD